MPTHCPDCGTDARAREGGRRRHPLPEHPVLPGAAARAAVPPGRPRRVRHRGARLRGGGRRCSRPASSHDEGDLFDLDRGQLARASPFFTPQGRRRCPRNARASCSTTSSRPRPGRSGGCSSRCRSGTSGPTAAQALARELRLDRRDPRPRRPRSWPPSTASARRSPRRSSSGSRSTGTAAIVEQVGARPASGWRRSAVDDGPRPLEGLTVVVTGIARRLLPRRRDRGDPARAAARSSARCRRRPTSSWSATTRARKYDKAVPLGRARSSTRTASACCSPTVPTPPARSPDRPGRRRST